MTRLMLLSVDTILFHAQSLRAALAELEKRYIDECSIDPFVFDSLLARERPCKGP